MTDQNPEPNPYEQQFTKNDLQPLQLVSPTGVAMLTGITQTPMGKLVLLRFETPLGSFVFMASSSKAKEYALELAATAAKAESGLIVPPSAM